MLAEGFFKTRLSERRPRLAAGRLQLGHQSSCLGTNWRISIDRMAISADRSCASKTDPMTTEVHNRHHRKCNSFTHPRQKSKSLFSVFRSGAKPNPYDQKLA